MAAADTDPPAAAAAPAVEPTAQEQGWELIRSPYTGRGIAWVSRQFCLDNNGLHLRAFEWSAIQHAAQIQSVWVHLCKSILSGDVDYVIAMVDTSYNFEDGVYEGPAGLKQEGLLVTENGKIITPTAAWHVEKEIPGLLERAGFRFDDEHRSWCLNREGETFGDFIDHEVEIRREAKKARVDSTTAAKQ